MSTSETVQAAQRLEIRGTLVRMGGEVPRLEIECDNGEIVEVANLPPALLSEMPMLLYKRVRLVVEADACPCGDRTANACPGQWEPGCDLGANEAHAVPAPAEAEQALRAALMQNPIRFIVCDICGNKRCPHAQDKGMHCTGSNEPGQVGVPIERPAPAAAPENAERRFGPVMSDPADAERNIRAKEDAERAAYLARWKDAPEWAQWLSQDSDGRCDFWEVKPALYEDEEWCASDGEPTHTDRRTDDNFTGSVNCEPRPVPADGQGVES